MSYAVKYWTRWKGQLTEEVQILEDGFQGQPSHRIAAGVPAKITYGKRDSDDRIKASYIDYDLYVFSQVEFEDFFNAPVGKYIMRYFINGIKVWEGFVVGDLYQEKDSVYPQAVTVRAIDGIGYLDEDFDPQGIREMSRVLGSVTPGEHDLYISDNIIPNDWTGSPWNILMDDNVYEGVSRREVLRELMEAKDCFVLLWSGASNSEIVNNSYTPGDDPCDDDTFLAWWVLRRPNMSSQTSVWRFFEDGELFPLGVPGLEPNVDYDLTQLSSERLRGFDYMLREAFREVRCEYRHGVTGGIIKNDDFSDFPDGQDVATHWTLTGNGFRTPVSQEDAYSQAVNEIGTVPGPDPATNEVFQTGGFVTNAAGVSVLPVINYRVNSPILPDPGETVTLWWRVQVGGYHWNDGPKNWEPTRFYNPIVLTRAQIGQWLSQELEINLFSHPDDGGVFEIGLTGARYAGSVGSVAPTAIYDYIPIRFSGVGVADNVNVSKYISIGDQDGQGVVHSRSVRIGSGPSDVHASRLRDDITLYDWTRQGQTDNSDLQFLINAEIIRQYGNATALRSGVNFGYIFPNAITSIEGKDYTWTYLECVNPRQKYWQAEYREVQYEVVGIDTFLDRNVSIIGATSSVNQIGVSIINEVSRLGTFGESQSITVTTIGVSGTVTQIPIEPVGSQILAVGDVFYLFNLSGASLTEFTLAEPQLPDDTSLTVVSKVLSETIVSGSWVIFTGERVANYITRSNSGIRLGVRSYSQGLLAGGAWAAEDGSDFALVDDDYTAGSRYTFAEIAILQGQIVLKTRADGRLALVRLDSNPKTGSLVEIQADNINLRGLVTAINADEDDFTQIDGGKIRATSRVTVGTGDNIAVLSGDHPLYRIWAGSNDPNAAPFRVMQTGETFATRFVLLSGEEVDGVIERFSIRDLDITGSLTIKSGGVLRTEEDETVFNENGIQFSLPVTLGLKSTLVWGAAIGSESVHIGAAGGTVTPTLEYRALQHMFRDQNDDQVFALLTTSSNKTAAFLGDRITFNVDDLPKSTAGLVKGDLYLVEDGTEWAIKVKS